MACCCGLVVPGCVPRGVVGTLPACDGIKESVTLEVFDSMPNTSGLCAPPTQNPQLISSTHAQVYSLSLVFVGVIPGRGCRAIYRYTQPLLPAPDDCGPQQGLVEVDLGFTLGDVNWSVTLAYARGGGFCCRTGSFDQDCTIGLPGTNAVVWSGPVNGFGFQACSNLEPQTITTTQGMTWGDRLQTSCKGNSKVRITA